MSETPQEQDKLEAAWDVFQLWTGGRDADLFRRSYLGHEASREAFGQELLSRLGADGRIQRLPEWLRAYVRFDGEAVVRDFEMAGHFYIYDAPQRAAPSSSTPRNNQRTMHHCGAPNRCGIGGKVLS